MKPHSTKEKLTAFAERTIGRIGAFVSSRLEGTDKAVYGLLLLGAFLLGGRSLVDIGLPAPIAFFLFGALAAVATALAVWAGKWILKACLHRGERHLIVLVILFVSIYYFCMWARMDIASGLQAGVAAAVCFVVFAVFARSACAVFCLKRRSPAGVAVCLCSGLAFGAIVYLTVSPGFSDSYVENYVRLGQTDSSQSGTEGGHSEGSGTERSHSEASGTEGDHFEASGTEGSHSEESGIEAGLAEADFQNGEAEVGVIEYGAERKRVRPPKEGVDDELESTSIDLSSYVDGYGGLDAKYRELYLGYGIKNVPLAGRIWYPKQGEGCPVVFLIHGNHNFTAQSYLGYAYLGEYLASCGYVVVSVDENFCNGDLFGDLEEENDARAILLLENIGNILTYSRAEGNPLFGKLDEERIAVAGHSRGGEAAAVAAYFNTLSNYPENGKLRFDYGYAIRSVIAIAPTSNQYQPLDRSAELTDVNYLLLQGANDQDVSVFLGAVQYGNVSFTGEGDYFKSYLYIAGANHGQFNTEWGRYDMDFPLNLCLNVKNLMDGDEQRKILKTFARTFLDVTLRGQEDRGLFYDAARYETQLPKTVYVQGYADSSFEAVCNFEEDLDLTTGTMEGSRISAAHISEWTEKLSRFSSGGYPSGKEDYALSIKWKKTGQAYVRVQLPGYDAAGKTLSFDILDLDNAKVKNGTYRLLDCTVVLTDQNGRCAQTTLARHATVYPPLPVRLSKLQFLFGENDYKHQFQTVRIPVSALDEEDDFDASHIKELRFCFDQNESGSIRLDNVGFAR